MDVFAVLVSKVIVFPSDTAVMVPNSSVLYTMTPAALSFCNVSLWGWP